jgi:hypothetical protein
MNYNVEVNGLKAIIAKGSVDDRKNVITSFINDVDNYFDVAEDFVRKYFVSGDDLFSDSDALFSVCTKLGEMVAFNSAKYSPKKDGGFIVEVTKEDGTKLIAEYSKASVDLKKELFKAARKGLRNNFAIGEIILLKSFVSGDDLISDSEVFASAAWLAALNVEFSDVTIKKN